MAKETADAQERRWAELDFLQKEYRNFGDFLQDCMDFLGFRTSDIQLDVGSFMAYGPPLSMVEAQRGQAKTTIAAIFAVWCLIHSPAYRVLVISAGGTQANEISTLIVRIILGMDELECLRPDKTAGDRTSVEAFDIHYTLKGVDKSPSVACVGITSNLQGKRADLLIADDIESAKNSRTALMRALLLDLTRDFSSICSTGRILYLGTPQSIESIYNTLPSRGFTVRIWPGRYPTLEQCKNYGGMLAPILVRRMEADASLCGGGGLLGDQGKPTDPTYITEDVLQAKEADQGSAYFQLQHMLSTALSDAGRYPLKLDEIICMPLGRRYSPQQTFPLTVSRGLGVGTKDVLVNTVPYKMAPPGGLSEDQQALQGRVLYVDPAGGGANGDETGYAVTGFLNGNIYVLAVGGLPGGYSVEQMTRLANIAKDWQVNVVKVEKNMGYGAFTQVWLPILRSIYPEGSVEEDYVTGQKELRIIETLEPIISRGSLILNEQIVADDAEMSSRYEVSKQTVYSLFHQISKITRERGALMHDDRVDALEGACRHWAEMLAVDQKKRLETLRKEEWTRRMADPMQRNRYSTTGPNPQGMSMLSKYRR
jgi:hypothetical protein